jgi:TPM domain
VCYPRREEMMEPKKEMSLAAFKSRGRCFLLWCLAAVALLFVPTQMHAATEVPTRPESYLLDQGDVFPPDVEARIVKALKAGAADYDVHIYVMTVPSLKVMPSRIGEKLHEQLNATGKKWLAGQVGALVIFDDEAGQAAIGASDEAEKAFSAVALNIVMKDPKLQSKRKRSSPEKLAGTVTLLIQHFTELRTRTNEEARRQRTTRLIFGGIVFTALLAVASFVFLKMKAKATRVRRRDTVALKS